LTWAETLVGHVVIVRAFDPRVKHLFVAGLDGEPLFGVQLFDPYSCSIEPFDRKRQLGGLQMTAVLHRTTTSTTPMTAPMLRRQLPCSPPSVATYRRRRAVVGTVLAVFVAVGAVATHDVLAGSGGVPASAAVSLPAQARMRIVAQPGDSLWSIASAHHGDISITRYVDTLVDLNGGPTIQAGQEVVLP